MCIGAAGLRAVSLTSRRRVPEDTSRALAPRLEYGSPVGTWGRLMGALLVAACGSSGATDAGVDGARDGGVVDGGLPPPPAAEPGRHDVELLETRRVVPSDGLPVETQRSNNNLDVIRHGGLVYLAWRTAPDHFASTETVIHVASSEDELVWTHETTFSMGTDLREPRFLTIGESLFLYVSVLGANPLAFEPMGVRVSERGADGTWSELEDVGLPGYIAWRARAPSAARPTCSRTSAASTSTSSTASR